MLMHLLLTKLPDSLSSICPAAYSIHHSFSLHVQQIVCVHLEEFLALVTLTVFQHVLATLSVHLAVTLATLTVTYVCLAVSATEDSCCLMMCVYLRMCVST